MRDDPGPIPADLYDDPPFDDETFDKVIDALNTAADDRGQREPDAALANGLLLDGDDDSYAARHLVPEAARRWRVSNDREAEWVARKYAEADAARRAAVDKATGWADEIVKWERRVTRKVMGTMAWAEALLRDYALRQRDETGGERKTVVLPSGDVATRSKPPHPVVAKEDEFLPWAEENAPDLVRHPPAEPAKDVFKRRLRVEDRAVAVDENLTLVCGHVLPVRLRLAVDGEVQPGATTADDAPDDDSWECQECEDDPIEGRFRQVRDREVIEMITEPCVVDVETGKVVPGLAVAPEEITANVKIGGPK